MNTQVRNDFRAEVFEAGCLRFDHRWKSWAKWIDRVDQSKSDGYAFEGDFIGDGTIEIEVGQPRLILAMCESGSAKHHIPYYAVVRLDADGSLHDADIATDGSKPGWALRIRDKVAAALEALEALEGIEPVDAFMSGVVLAQFTDQELIDEIQRRGSSVAWHDAGRGLFVAKPPGATLRVNLGVDKHLWMVVANNDDMDAWKGVAPRVDQAKQAALDCWRQNVLANIH